MKIAISATLAALMLGTAAPALADIRIDARQANQLRQIDAGGRSGKLSRRERDVLTAEQRSIKRLEARFDRNDGGLGPREKAQLNRLLDVAQRNIVRMKNNRERGARSVNL